MNLTEHLLQAEGVLIAMKGQNPEAELKILSAAIQLILLCFQVLRLSGVCYG